MKYTVKFPVGDWSADGHEKCDWFMIESNKLINDIREAHFKCREMLGFEIGDICSGYGDTSLNEDLLEKLKKFDIDFSHLKDWSYIDPEEIVQLWINILMSIDENLKLKVIEDNVPSINFYGFDDQGRNLKVPGYGLF